MLWLTQCSGSPSMALPAAESAGMVVKYVFLDPFPDFLHLNFLGGSWDLSVTDSLSVSSETKI